MAIEDQSTLNDWVKAYDKARSVREHYKAAVQT